MKKVLLWITLTALLVPWASNAQQSIPYFEGFEAMSSADDLTADGWISYKSNSGSFLAIETAPSNVHSGSKALNIDSWDAGSSSDYVIVGLPLMDAAINTLQISFSYKVSTGSVYVGYLTDADDASTFVSVNTYSSSSSYSTIEPLSLASVPSTAARIAIKYLNWYRCYIDDILVETPPTCIKPTALEATLTPGDGSVASLSWTAGGTETDWVLEYGTASDFNGATSVNVSGTPSKDLTGLTAETTYYARVKADCGGDGESEWSTEISFTPTMATFIGNGTGTSSYVPLYGNYKSSYAQMIYTASQLNAVGINTEGEITIIGFNSSAVNSMARNVKIYMGLTSKTQFSSTTDFVNFSDLKLVYDYENHTPWNITAGWNDFVLDTPFDYDGTSGLVIAVHCGLISNYASSNFYYTSTGHEQAIYAYDDTSDPIPASFNPSSYSGTKSTTKQLPNLKVLFSTVNTPKPKNFAISNITANGATLAWEAPSITPSGYEYQFKKSSEESWSADVPVNDLSANLSGLEANSDYDVRVRAIFDAGKSKYVSASFTTLASCAVPFNLAASEISAHSAKIAWEGNSDSYNVQYRTAAYAEGYEETFGTTIPSGWSMYTGLLNNGTATLSSATYGWSFGSNNGVFDNHARVNIYDNYQRWLVMPEVKIGDDFIISFDLALTAYSGTVTSPANTGTDDKFIVLISTDNMATWTALRQWDNAGSTYVYNDIACSATGEHVSIDIAAYSGQNAYVAFYGESTISNADNNLHIDNVLLGVNHEAGNWNEEASNESPKTLSGLAADTKYDVQVRGICGDITTVPSESISFTTPPSCLPISGLTISNITTSGASFSWEDNSTQGQWQYAYAQAGEDPVWNGNIVNAKSANVSGLNANTSYDFYVRAYCGPDDQSEAIKLSFHTECLAISVENAAWTEGFEGDLNTDNSLPYCWSKLSASATYPYAYNSSYSAHDGNRYLYFYGGGSAPQIAVLPQFEQPLSELVISFYHHASSGASYGKLQVGYLSDASDSTTFVLIEAFDQSASYVLLDELSLASVPAEATNLALRYSGGTSNFGYAYVDDIEVKLAPSCIKPSDFEVEVSGLTATLSWESGDNNFSIAHATSAEANPDDNILTDGVADKSVELSDLALGNHYFWVRTDCSDTEHSEWVGPVSAHLGYCVPSVSSVDGDGISNVTFGMGDNVVNNNTSKATYIDCLDKIGAVQAGVEATIAITYATGYTYGTLIWVDLNKNLEFEDNEILYKGTSTNANPTTLNATITIPANQELGDYVMRIGGADSGFDSFISGSSTTAPNACYSGNWACFQDYTLHVLETPSCLPVSGLTLASVETNSASFSWTPGASEAHWQYACVAKDADPVWDNENIVNTASASVSGLNANSSYDFYVRAYCDSEHQSEAIKLNFHTECAVIIVDAEHPFFEGFENSKFAPNCWSDIESNSHSWSRKTSYSHSGSASAYSGWYGDIYLIMPDIQIENVSEEVLLTFWSYNEYVGSYEKNSVVLLDGSNEIELWAPTSVNNSWVETSINLSAYKGQTISLAFKYEGDNAHGWYIDDVSIRSNISIAINASRYATYYNADDAYIMPEGLVGHIFNATDKLVQTYVANNVVPAGVPLVLEGDQGNYQLIPTMANGVAPTEEDNDLIGNNEEGKQIGSATDGYVYYVLSLAAVNPGDEPNYNSVGFYYMLDEGKGGFSMPAHKAYLKYAASSAPARFYLFNGENGATWLNSLEGVEGTVKFMHEGNIYILRDSIIYDATGRKVRELK